MSNNKNKNLDTSTFNSALDVESNPVIKTQLSWVERTFSPFDSTSLRNSIITLIISALGTGVFTTHTLFNEIGIIASIILIFASMMAYIASMEYLNHASEASNQSRSLNELIRNILGLKVSIVYDSLFFMNNYIVLIAFLSTIFNNLFKSFKTQIFQIISGPADTAPGVNPFKENVFRLVFSVFSFIILVFLNRMRSLKGLASFSIFSIVSFCLTIGTCVAQTYIYYQPTHKINWTDVTMLSLLENFGLVIFSFNCLFNFYGMKNSLKNPIGRRIKKISYRSFGILTCIILILGFSTYFSLGQANASKLKDLFIFRDQIGETDYMMILCRVCLSISLYISYAYVTQPLKATTGFLFNHENSDVGNNLSSVFFSLSPIIICFFFNDINFFVGISGTFTTSFIVFVFPTLLAIKTDYSNNRVVIVLMWIWIGVATVLAFVGTAMIIEKQNRALV